MTDEEALAAARQRVRDRIERDGIRRAEPGELCDCGRQAMSVVRGPDGTWGGVCGLDNGGVPPGGVCPFCGDELDHSTPRVDDALNVVGVFRQGGKCPRYRLRLTDPIPAGAP